MIQRTTILITCVVMPAARSLHSHRDVFPDREETQQKASRVQRQIHLAELCLAVVSVISMVCMPVDEVSQQRLGSGHGSPVTFHRASLWIQRRPCVYTAAADSEMAESHPEQ